MTTSPDGMPDPLDAAMRHHQAGDLATARRLYRSHLETAPDDAAAWCLLAALEGQAGDHGAAGAVYRKAINADPRHAPAHAGLGTSLLFGGDPSAAVGPFREALGLRPEMSDARAQLALSLHRLGRLDQAIEELRELAERHPGDPQACRNLGMALLDRGDTPEALELFARLVERKPDLPEGWIGLASAQMRLDLVTEADRSLTRALGLMPAAPAGRAKLGVLLLQQGRRSDARRCLEAALQKDPRYVAALAALADMDRVEGDWSTGLARIAPALEATPRPDPLLMITAASLWVESGAWDEAETRISAWLDNQRLDDRPRAKLERLRADALDQLERHDAAWRHWTEANRRAGGRFDPDDFDRTIDALIAAFDRPGPVAGIEVRPPRSLLIVGMPRSGKSILEQLLACHPLVHGAGERRIVGALTELARMGASGERPYPACVQDLDENAVNALADHYGAALRKLSPSAVWVTDTQPTNYLHLGLVHRLRPDMRVVYCRRQPLDVAWACYARGIPDRALAFTTDPAWIGRYLAGMERLMGHWVERLEIPVLSVDYESLVTHPEVETRRVLNLMDLAWDPACADYIRPAAATLTAPLAIGRALDGAEIGRGRPYLKQLAAVQAFAHDRSDG